MAEATPRSSELISEIKSLYIKLRHEKVDCETQSGPYSNIKDSGEYKRLCDHLKDLKLAIDEFLVPLTERQLSINQGYKKVDRDSGISICSRTSALSLRESFPVQETVDSYPSYREVLPLEHDEQSSEPNITKHEECMLNNSANSVRGRRTQHERKNIASAAIPEEKPGESQNDLSEHSSDEN